MMIKRNWFCEVEVRKIEKKCKRLVLFQERDEQEREKENRSDYNFRPFFMDILTNKMHSYEGKREKQLHLRIILSSLPFKLFYFHPKFLSFLSCPLILYRFLSYCSFERNPSPLFLSLEIPTSCCFLQQHVVHGFQNLYIILVLFMNLISSPFTDLFQEKMNGLRVVLLCSHFTPSSSAANSITKGPDTTTKR